MSKKYLDYTGLGIYNDKIEQTYLNKESSITDGEIDSLFGYQGGSDDDSGSTTPVIPDNMVIDATQLQNMLNEVFNTGGASA